MIPKRALSKVRGDAMGFRKRRWREGLGTETDVCYSDILEALLESESEDGEISRAVAAMCGLPDRCHRLITGLTEAWIATAQRTPINERG